MPKIRVHSATHPPDKSTRKVRHRARIQNRKRERIKALMVALSSKSARAKFGAFKTLRALAEREPDLICPHFDRFVSLLGSENSILRWNAMLILGDLARADRERKMDGIIEDYLAPISGPHLIDAANTIRGATAIAASKPHLADKITRAILKVEGANYATPECRNVAIGHAINSFVRLYPSVAEQRAVQLFVLRQLDNGRPATRKKAENFLRKWPLARSA